MFAAIGWKGFYEPEVMGKIAVYDFFPITVDLLAELARPRNYINR